MSNPNPFIIHSTEIFQQSHVLFDTNFISSIVTLGIQDEVLQELKNTGAACRYLHPVLIESLRVDRRDVRSARAKFFNSISRFPIEKKYDDYSVILQRYLQALNVRPSFVDLYLGSALVQTAPTYLISGNISDFPYPIFKRPTHVITQGDRDMKIYAVLEMDEEYQARIKSEIKQ